MKTSGGKAAQSSFEPLRKVYRRYILLGGSVTALGVLQTALLDGPTVYFTLGIAAGMGLCFVALGVWGLRAGSAAPVLTSSLNLLQTGRLAEASALLDTLEQNTSPTVVMSRHIQRAMIAQRLGDLGAAARHADSVLAVPKTLLFRVTQEVQRGAALGIRAWARAATGDAEGAMSDVSAVRASEAPGPEALGHAALAEAVVLERRGDRDGLAAALRKNRRLLLMSLDVRERSIVRALQRLLKTTPKSIYRTASDPKKAEAEAERGREREDAPPIAEWIERVAPELSAFALEPRAPAPARDRPAPPELVPSAEAIAQAEAQAPKAKLSPWLRVLLLWAALIGMFFAIWQVLAPPEGAVVYEDLPPPAPPDPLLALWGVAFAAFLVGLFAWLVRRNQSQTRALTKLAAAVANGEAVDAELLAMTKSKQHLTAAQAEILRASLADRRGQLTEGLAYIDAGRARINTEGTRAAAAAMLLPILTSTRAYLLAALGRADDAAAELARIPPDYAFLDRTRFAVKLVALLARGDVDGAARLVDATPPEISIGPRDELLRDLTRAATAPNGVGAAEIARLRDELREDDEAQRWISKVAPALLVRFEKATVAEEDSAAGGAGAFEAEREAAAEEEAARARAARA